MYFLGIDVGATKTHALLTDEHGTPLALCNAGSGNPESVGYTAFARVVSALVENACQQANITKSTISSAGFGIAGFDWPSEEEEFSSIIRSIIPGVPFTLVNDALLGIPAGTTHGWGISLVAGTSFNCRGLSPDGNQGRVIGEGLKWGEAAGSTEVVLRAVQAVAAEWTHRGQPTTLTPALLSFYNETSVPALVEKLVLKKHFIDPTFAPTVFELARQGDSVAVGVVNWAADQLASLVIGVARQLDLINIPVEVVLVGSMFNTGDILLNPLQHQIHKYIPNAKLVRLNTLPVTGAVLLAVQKAGLPTTDFLKRLKQSLNATNM